MELTDAITNRRSVRKYQDTPVLDEDISYVLDMARLAPSWVNKQCWRFIVVTDSETIEHVAKSTNPINYWLKRTPCLILTCADPKESGDKNGQAYYLVDSAIATEHLVLAAASKGLGTCWIGAFNEEKIKKLLSIPKRIRIVSITPLGYPAEDKSIREKVQGSVIKSKKRKSLEEIIHWEKW